MTFADRLYMLRKQKGITQEQLAEKLGITRQAVAKWETGAGNPDANNLILLSEYFHVTLDGLIKGPRDGCIDKTARPDALPADGELLSFLLCAKRSTYAANGKEASPSRTASHDYCYQEGKMTYIDSYLGSKCFSGEEALWVENEPVWAMNYSGRVIAEGFSGDFLKEALLLVSPEYPFRGPPMHRNGDYIYHCTIQGEFEWFNGFEEIFCRDIKVYECAFHGGAVR